MQNPLIENIDQILSRLRECIAYARKIGNEDVSVTDEFVSMRALHSSETYHIDSAVKELFQSLYGTPPDDSQWMNWYDREYQREKIEDRNPHLHSRQTTVDAWENMLGHFLATRTFLSKLLHEQDHRREIEAARTPSNQYKEIIMGDVFKNISNSRIVNRSTYFDTMSALESKEQTELMPALDLITKEVASSENAEAGELLEQLLEELQRTEPRTSLIRRSWEGLCDILPSVSKIATAAAALGKLLD